MTDPRMRDRDRRNSPRVRLDDMTEDQVLTVRKWFLDSHPATQTCQPIALKTDAEVIWDFRERVEDGKSRDFAIRRLADSQLLGRIRYFNLNTRNRSVEIGYLLAREFRGQGYASEALGLLLEHLFGELGLNKVYAQTGEFNTASIALLERSGFKQDARLRQHHVLDGTFYDDLIYSLLAEDHAG